MASGKKAGKRSQQQNDFLEASSPINVVATDVGTNRPFNDGAASVSFELPVGSTPADSFSVSAEKVGTGEDLTVTNATGTESPIVVGGLDSNSSYIFTVTAINNSGESVPSAPTTAILITTVPSTPIAPTVQGFSNDQNDYVTITVPTSNGGKAISQYNWESDDNKSGNRATAGQFTVLQEATTTQKYRVRAVNANGPSEWSPYSGNITTPPFFPPFFPFFPPFFPFFPPSFPFFPFFPPMFPFFPFFPPRFPPFFPFFPFFPPRFKVRFCLAADTQVLTTTKWDNAASLKPGDKVLTISSNQVNFESLQANKIADLLPSMVELVEVDVVSVTAKKSVLVGFNNLGKDFSVDQPVFVKVESEEHICYKDAGEVEIGDVLLAVSTEGHVQEIVVESIQRDTEESDVYDIRTGPLPWFITKSSIVIS